MRFKVILTAMILSILMAVPVMAQEVTDPEKVIKEETFNAGEEILQKEFHNSEIWRAGYYVEYLDGVIFNLEEYARIKKEVLDNYTDLAKVNPMYAQYIPQATRDYQKALEWVAYYKLYNKCVQVDFKGRYGF